VPSPRTRWIGLVVVSLAVALIIVDSTIVTVAVPSIVEELGLSSTEVQWVQESYTLVFASLLLVFGTLADRIGRRRMLLLGITIFALSSVVAALAGSGGALIAARVVQGVGGAMLLPTTLSIINAGFRGKDRAIAFAVWGSTIGGMAAVGPLLGGWLTTFFSWRWAFGINVPLGIIIIVGALLFVAASRDPNPGRLDLVGAAISVVLFGTLVFGLIEGRSYGWWLIDTPFQVGDWTWPLDLSPVPLAFAVSALALVAFIMWGLRRSRSGRSTLIDFGLFRIPSFRNGNIVAMLVSLGEFGIILSIPLWLQTVLDYDALQAGLVLVALAGGSFVASGFAGSLGARLRPVLIVRAGLLAEILGLLIVALVLAVDVSPWAIAGGLAVYGFGVGLATAQLTGVVLNDVPIEESGRASGTQSTSRQVGSALGIAILGTILFGALGTHLDARLADEGFAESARAEIVDAVVDSAGTAISGFDAAQPAVADAAREAFTDSTRLAALAAAGFLTAGLVASASLGGRRETEDAELVHRT
tara:strand:- start:198186 stop:199775 length:1590 start_codon:yes stop_codon:yes gene_type:complete